MLLHIREPVGYAWVDAFDVSLYPTTNFYSHIPRDMYGCDEDHTLLGYEHVMTLETRDHVSLVVLT